MQARAGILRKASPKKTSPSAGPGANPPYGSRLGDSSTRAHRSASVVRCHLLLLLLWLLPFPKGPSVVLIWTCWALPAPLLPLALMSPPFRSSGSTHRATDAHRNGHSHRVTRTPKATNNPTEQHEMGTQKEKNYHHQQAQFERRTG